jgi:hypothetical protein
MLVNRDHIAAKLGITRKQLRARMQKLWKHFPDHVCKHGRHLMYDERVVDDFILNNIKPKKLTRTRKDTLMQFGGIKRIDSYFNGQMFLNVEVNFEALCYE